MKFEDVEAALKASAHKRIGTDEYGDRQLPSFVRVSPVDLDMGRIVVAAGDSRGMVTITLHEITVAGESVNTQGELEAADPGDVDISVKSITVFSGNEMCVIRDACDFVLRELES